MILCSPSPGTEPSERMTWIPCQPGSLESFLLMNARRKSARLSMKGVPGVIVFESNAWSALRLGLRLGLGLGLGLGLAWG